MTYIVRADIEAVYGRDNVSKWADLNNNNDAGEITARVDRAIAVAGDELDSRLRRSQYRVPLEGVTGTLPYVVKDMVATLAGVWLYESRGVVDAEDGSHRLQYGREKVGDQISDILANRLWIDCVEDGGATCPTVITQDVPPHGVNASGDLGFYDSQRWRSS